MDDETAERLLADEALERYASVLRSERRYRPYLLSEAEEKALDGEERHGRERVGTPLQRPPLRAQRLAGRPRAAPRRGDLAALARDRAVGAAAGRRSGHRGAPSGPADARLRPQHDPERARDRGSPARLLVLDRGAQPRQRDPRRGGPVARRRDRRALRHPAALLRAEGAAARPAAPGRLRPRRAAPGGRRHDRLGRRARARPRVVRRLLADGGRHRRPVLRGQLDRRRAAAGEDRPAPSAPRRSPASTRTCS